MSNQATVLTQITQLENAITQTEVLLPVVLPHPGVTHCCLQLYKCLEISSSPLRHIFHYLQNPNPTFLLMKKKILFVTFQEIGK